MPTDAEYQRLLRFRIRLREFDRWSKEAAADVGLTHTQHQLLLAVRGSLVTGGPTISDVAEALLVRRHTATELVDRTVALGFVERLVDAADHRRVRLRLTSDGDGVLRRLTDVHLTELRGLAQVLGDV